MLLFCYCFALGSADLTLPLYRTSYDLLSHLPRLWCSGGIKVCLGFVPEVTRGESVTLTLVICLKHPHPALMCTFLLCYIHYIAQYCYKRLSGLTLCYLRYA